jgi:hypothetical protein
MDTVRDTFLVAVYTQIDTLLTTEFCLPPRPGPPPKMSDSEVLTLLVIGQAHGSSERALLRWAADSLAAYFPVLLSPSAFNRRVRRLGPICTQLMLALADLLGAETSPYQVVDTTAVPLARQCRGERHRLFAEEAAVGVGGSDHQFFYGCSLLLVTAADGPITGLVLGPANTQERWLLDALLAWRLSPVAEPWTVADLNRRSRRGGGGRVGPTGPRWWPDSVGQAGMGLYLADRGFGGPAWTTHWAEDDRAWVLVETDAMPPATRQGLHHCRQVIETVNGLLHDTFHLDFPRAKTMWGVITRTIAKCTALNVGIWANRVLGRPDFALSDLFPA